MTDSPKGKLPEKRQQKKSSFWTRHREFLSILAGGVIALAGAGIGANAALGGVEKQIQAQNEARSQDKRDVAYKAYLEAANDYFYAWDGFLMAQTPEARGEASERFQAARYEFRTQTNEVWTHGSNRAIEAMNDVSRTVPESLALSDLPPLDVPADPTAFRDAYNEFLRVRCVEVAPVSRVGCAPTDQP